MTRAEALDRASRIWGARFIGLERSGREPDVWGVATRVAPDGYSYHLLDANGHASCHLACVGLEAAAFGDPPRAEAPAERPWLTKGETCEETTGMVGDTYLRCGRPAVMAVYHKGRREPVYKMCRACGTHNVSNRGAIELAPVEREAK